MRRALAREQLELAVYRARPCGNDAERDLQPESIQSVSQLACAQGGRGYMRHNATMQNAKTRTMMAPIGSRSAGMQWKARGGCQGQPGEWQAGTRRERD